MKLQISSTSLKEIFSLIKHKGPPISQNPAPDPIIGNLEEELDKILRISNQDKVSVLCFDVYKYSQNSQRNLMMIPLVLKFIHDTTFKILNINESFLFNEKYNPVVTETGDGAICLFPTPLHSIAYAIWFEIILRFYNTYHILPELRKIIGNLVVRYGIAYDTLLKIDNNYYGPAIINACRLISKDKLNRCLIDSHSIEWFLRNFNGIENLLYLDKSELIHVLNSIFPNEKFHSRNELISIFDKEKERHWGIRTIDIQQIGELFIKETKVSVYNLHIQALCSMIRLHKPDYPEEKDVKVTISLGNLNSQGIHDNF